MTDPPKTAQAAADAATQPASPHEGWGWYLYGITRMDQQPGEGVRATVWLGGGEGDEDDEPLEVIAQGDVQAVVRRVPLAEFAPEALRARAEEPAWIEAMARRHNSTLEAIHRDRTILPAKFGSVYASMADLSAALQAAHEKLLAQLQQIAGCDEWGVRLYADLATIRQWVESEHAGVQRLRQELASATPGRAYFLQRKLEDELAAAAEQGVDDLVERAYARLIGRAVAGEVNRRIGGSRIVQHDGEAEVLRAAFLVRREQADMFLDDVRTLAESQPSLRCEYSGPWPPYSFATLPEEETP